MKKRHSLALAALALTMASHAQTCRFDFGSAEAADGFVAVTADMMYTAERGYGFEPGVAMWTLQP